MKKLTESQRAALARLTQGDCDYYDLAKVGANGKTINWLSVKGLAAELGGQTRKWSITQAGTAAHVAGRA